MVRKTGERERESESRKTERTPRKRESQRCMQLMLKKYARMGGDMADLGVSVYE